MATTTTATTTAAATTTTTTPTTTTTTTTTTTATPPTSSASPSRRHALVALFDFDHSLIDVNSDPHIVLTLESSLERALRALVAEHPGRWTWIMDEMMRRVHASGHSAAAVEACARSIAVAPQMRRVLHAYAAAGVPLAIVSDANECFIRWILAANELDALFAPDAVFTNHAHVDDDGRVRIAPYQPADEPHRCSRCPVNMCKGGIVRTLVGARGDAPVAAAATLPPFAADRIIYLGDGGGDVCGCLSLDANDVVVARAEYPLHRAFDRLADDGDATRRAHSLPAVHVWSNYDDVERIYTEQLTAALLSSSDQ